jgi:hypothetical protein
MWRRLSLETWNNNQCGVKGCRSWGDRKFSLIRGKRGRPWVHELSLRIEMHPLSGLMTPISIIPSSRQGKENGRNSLARLPDVRFLASDKRCRQCMRRLSPWSVCPVRLCSSRCGNSIGCELQPQGVIVNALGPLSFRWNL